MMMGSAGDDLAIKLALKVLKRQLSKDSRD